MPGSQRNILIPVATDLCSKHMKTVLTAGTVYLRADFLKNVFPCWESGGRVLNCVNEYSHFTGLNIHV